MLGPICLGANFLSQCSVKPIISENYPKVNNMSVSSWQIFPVVLKTKLSLQLYINSNYSHVIHEVLSLSWILYSLHPSFNLSRTPLEIGQWQTVTRPMCATVAEAGLGALKGMTFSLVRIWFAEKLQRLHTYMLKHIITSSFTKFHIVNYSFIWNTLKIHSCWSTGENIPKFLLWIVITLRHFILVECN